MRAVDCAREAEIPRVVVSSDKFTAYGCVQRGLNMRRENDQWVDVTHETPDWSVVHLPRPAELAQDDTPMIAVVQHALAQIPGAADDIIVLLQPTQPFRTPAHVRAAMALLHETQADSVVSVVPLPLTHSPEMLCRISSNGLLSPTNSYPPEWSKISTQRQSARQYYKRDGTAYAFWRKTLTRCDSIYGLVVRPLVIDPAESCELDTEADWAEVERRWAARTVPV